MSASAAPGPPAAIVTRLRAAGCVFAADEARLLSSAARTPDELDMMVEQRAAGLPIEQVVGWAEFCGLRIAVAPGVFVPRYRTGFLVHQAVALARQALAGRETAARQAAASGPAAPAGPGAPGRARAVVVDLCCGAGAVGAALDAALDGVQLYAADIDPAAVRCARRNVGDRAQVYEGDLYDPLPGSLRGRVDILAANVPYVPTGEISLLPPEARLHEPRVALDGGSDGLEIMRRVAAAAPQWLAPGGSMLVETSERQVPQALETIAGAGLTPRLASSEELSATVVIGTRPGCSPAGEEPG